MSNWYVDEIQMSYQPIALGPSAIPATSNLFNFEAANQSRWDLFLFSRYPQQEFRDRSCQELNVFCPPGPAELGVCHHQVLPGLCQVTIVSFKGDVWGGRGLQGLLRGLRGGLCVCVVVVQVLILVLSVSRASSMDKDFACWPCRHQSCSSVL